MIEFVLPLLLAPAMQGTSPLTLPPGLPQVAAFDEGSTTSYSLEPGSELRGVRVRRYLVRVTAAGEYSIRAKADRMDPMIALRGPAGKLMRHDDDSGLGTDADLAVTLRAGRRYTLDLVVRGSVGRVELELVSDTAPAPDRHRVDRLIKRRATAVGNHDYRTILCMLDAIRLDLAKQPGTTERWRAAVTAGIHKVSGPRSAIVHCWSQYGRILFEGHNFKEAGRWFEKARSGLATVPKPYSKLAFRTLLTCAGHLVDQQRFHVASGLLDLAVDALRRNPTIDLELQSELWLRVANVSARLGRRGDLQDAARSFRRLPDWSRDEPAGSSRLLFCLAVLEHIENRPAKAERLLLDALARSEKDERHSLQIELTLAGVRFRTRPLRVLDDLRVLQTRARRTLKARDPLVGAISYQLAFTLQSTGQNAEAMSVARDAVDTLVAAHSDNHPLSAAALDRLATLLEVAGKTDKAEALFRRALRARRDVLGNKHPHSVSSMNNLALLLLRAGRLAEASKLFEEADSCSEAVRSRVRSIIRSNWATLEMSRGNREKAKEILRRGYRDLCRHLDGALRFTGEQDRQSHIDSAATYVNLMMSLIGESKDRTAEACRLILNWKGRAYRSAIRAVDSLPRGSDKARRQLAAIREANDRIRHAIAAGDHTRLPQLMKARDAAEAILFSTAEKAGGVRELRHATVTEALPKRAAFLDFFVYRPVQWPVVRDGVQVRGGRMLRPRLIALVLRPDRAPKLIDLGGVAQLRRRMDAYLRSLGLQSGGKHIRGMGRRPKSRSGSSQTGQRLRQILWDRLLPEIRDVSVVVVSQCGELADFPLEIIPTAQGRFAIETHRFLYVPSAGSYVDAASRPNRDRVRSGVLLIGGLDYGARSDKITWPPLAGTAKEVHLIERIVATLEPREAVVTLSGKRATRAAVMRGLVRNRIVHFATHGFSGGGLDSTRLEQLIEAMSRVEDRIERGRPAGDELALVQAMSAPALTGLALSGANDSPARPAILTGEDVLWLDLRGCELAVLSACVTGVGVDLGSEGAISLRRSFHRAGVRTVVSSLWLVEDTSAATIMVDMYAAMLRRSVAAPEALHQAQLRWIKKARASGARADVRSWGAFVASRGR